MVDHELEWAASWQLRSDQQEWLGARPRRQALRLTAHRCAASGLDRPSGPSRRQACRNEGAAGKFRAARLTCPIDHSRAPHTERIASLMSSKQMDVALMPRDDAVALRDGAPPLAAHGRVPLHTIVGVGDYLLVCREDFPARHAWLICEALFKNQHAIPVPLSPLTPIAEPPDARVPLHPGAQAYIIGRPLPVQEQRTDHQQDHKHEHGDSTRP